MILDSIRLENFGAYGGVQKADLTPTTGKPVILFGGMNGGGKTTLLDALLLVLYGAKARVSNRGRTPYRDYLSECIHRGSDSGEGASIRLRFRRVVEGRTIPFEVERYWSEGTRGIEESLRVACDGVQDDIFTEHWDEIIEANLPVSISNLFFFDGEQIKELAEGSNAAAILGTAIRSLLGMDLVDRLEGDLKTFERRKKAEGLDPESAKQLRLAQDELREIETQMESLAQEKGRVANEAGRLAKDVETKQGVFKAEGGDLFLKRRELERELKHLIENKEQEAIALREIAAGPLPLRLVEDLLQAAEAQARTETAIKQNQVLADALSERDELILDRLQADGLEAKAITRIRETLNNDRRDRTLSAREPLVLDADDHLAAHLAHLRNHILPRVGEDARARVELIRRLEEKAARIESELGRVPEEDSIARFQQALEDSRKAHAAKMAEFDTLEARIAASKKRREEVVRQIDRFGEQHDSVCVAEDDRLRMLKHSERVRRTLAQFRIKVVGHHVANMEALILESFRKLLRKNELVHGLTIHPDTFEVTLKDRQGRVLPFDRLSAGERQLLATAILWGLARASGRPIPTVIDTPLGRLDSSHRRHLVERYFPNASHQVLLLSTDEEIVGGYHEKLRPAISRQYLLDHDEKLGCTNVRAGYFECYETAR